MTYGKTVILGGGLAGLSAAFHLDGAAALYEQRSNLGGLCREVHVDGFRFDIVPHVLHFQHDATRALISRLLDGRLQSFTRQARVFSHGTTIRYPFQGHLFGLPADVVNACVQGRLQAARRGPADTATFERWIVSTFGAGIAEHFMLPYNTKFWTVPPSELTCDWLDGLVPVPTVDQTVRGASMEDPSEYGYNVRFWYPSAGGLGAILGAFLKQIPHLNLGKRLERIETAAHRLHFSDGEEVCYDQLLSSIPLPELRHLLDPLPDEVGRALDALRWTSISVVHLGVKGFSPVPWHWAYVPDPEVSFYRVGVPSHYAHDAAPEGHHILSAEVSHTPGQVPAQEVLVPRVISDLKRLGLLRREEDIAVRLPLVLRYGYPMYDRQYAWAMSVIQRYLSDEGIVLIGRFGSWRYMSMEAALRDGQRAAKVASHRVNQDVALPLP